MNELYLGATAHKGNGVFSSSDIQSGDLIMEFTGPLVTRSELPQPYSSVLDHYTQVDEDLYMGPSGDLDDIINHSCNPNCGLREEDGRLMCYAIRDIAQGQELSWDYSTMQQSGWWEMDCLCGSVLCRGRIADFQDLPTFIRRKYLDLRIVAPYIAKQYEEAPVHVRPKRRAVPSRRMHLPLIGQGAVMA
ncbi:MAG: SET domain-containing protein-lysine N-methyltransferase [Candidatus Peregrinibacteria bacterium]